MKKTHFKMQSILLKILFIGNSFTLRNDMYKTFKSFNESILVGVCAGGSMTLQDHSKGSSRCIEHTDWDAVVLQEQSTALLHNRYDVGTTPFAKKLATQIRENNNKTEIYLFETWAYEHGWSWYTKESMQEKIRKGYLDVGAQIGAPTVFVGDAVTFASNNYEHKMWDVDGRHPSVHASFLTAVMFYYKLTDDIYKQLPCPFEFSVCMSLQQIGRKFSRLM